ncbi:MAG: hypothetical protein IJE89_05965 [Bacilli bacterium]|nr:hypothetical protein [Bacilli bacterium]
MKRIKIIGIFIIFVLAFISHFIYEWMPNSIFSILFPVNESIWEHMKLMATPVLIFSLFEYILYRKKNISFNNLLLSYAISIVLGIIIYLMIYLPIDYIFGHSAIVAIILLFIVFIIMEIISYYIMNYREIKYSNIIGIGIIILLYIIFGYLTYNPLEIKLFYDTEKKIYGIPK